MHRLYPYGLLILLSLFLSSCSLDDPEQGPGTFPLQILVEKEFSLLKLSWTPVKVTGFKEYIILQSPDVIPASPVPELNVNVTVLKRIDDPEVVTFFASEVLFAPQVCFKLYASVDDRFIESANICVDQDFTLLDGFHDRGAHEEGVKEMILYDRLNRTYTVFDYEQGSITQSISEELLNFPIMEMDTWAGSTNVFAYEQSPSRLRKYSFPEMNPGHFVTFGGVLFAVKVHEEFVFATAEEQGKGFKVLNRSSLSEIDNESGLTGNRNLGVFDGDPVIVMEVGDSGIRRYSIASNGQITFLDSKLNAVLQPLSQNTTAQGNEIFIAGRLGEIIDRNGDVVNKLISNINASVFMTRLTGDETKAAYIMSDNVDIKLVIVDLTDLQHIQKIVSYDLPQANYADMILDGNVIYLVGVSFSFGTAQTFSLKYPLP